MLIVNLIDVSLNRNTTEKAIKTIFFDEWQQPLVASNQTVQI